MRVADDFGVLTRGTPSILTIGTFDGMHRGHQYLIRQVVDRARRLEYDSVVVTFDPRPIAGSRPGNTQLSGAQEKLRIVGALAPSTVVVLPFSRELSVVSRRSIHGESPGTRQSGGDLDRRRLRLRP